MSVPVLASWPCILVTPKYQECSHRNLTLGCLIAATCILFGDGCGAVILTSQSGACSLLGSSMHSDGTGQRHLKACLYCHLLACILHKLITLNSRALLLNQALSSSRGLKAHDEEHASTQGSFANILMNGSEVFKFAVRAVPVVRLIFCQNCHRH